MRARLLLLAAVGLAVTGGSLASSSWTAGAAGSSSARTDALAAPGGLTAVRNTSGVQLSWGGSASPWADGYRVLRAPTAAGPYAEVVTLGATGLAHLDTTAHAGTWFYAVASTAGGWQQLSGVVQRSDPVHVVRATGAYVDAACPAAATRVDVQQGYSRPVGSGVSAALTTVSLCTDTWSAGQVLPAGTTTVTAYLRNTGNRTCTFDAVLLRGAASLGTGSGTVAIGATGAQPLVVAFATAGAVLADGERLAVRLTARAMSGGPTGNNCGSTAMLGDGSLAPSSVTLPV